jgi:hypothetical protein
MTKELINDKVITIEPSRNQLIFNKFEDVNLMIVNNHLNILIEEIKIMIPSNILEDGFTKFDLRINHLNYMIKISTKNDIIIKILQQSFLEDINCCYLKINDQIYKNGLYKDILNLEYNPHSFRQPDDSIREYIVQWFQKTLPRGWNSIIFFGGECTMLGKILYEHSISQYFYTDFISIYCDIIRNYNKPNVELIDYSIWKADKLQLTRDKEGSNCCIVNTGYKGMGINLSTEISKIGANEIYVISCNKDSWTRDWHILCNTYNLKEQMEIRTNYSVWIYKLSRISS